MDTITEVEALAGLKVLVAMAKADGVIHDDERRSLAGALENLEIPAGTSVDALLAEEVDVAAELAKLRSEDARTQIYRSAFFMAHADGACTKEEKALLERIAEATGASAELRASLERLFASSGTTAPPPSGVTAIADPAVRAQAVRSRVLKYAIAAAALGAFPIPGFAIVTDLAVIALQVKMIRDVGRYWGHEVDKNAAKSILYGLGLGTGARLAVNNLAKLFPGWGSAVGATTSFASTYALGKVIETFFAADAKVDIADLKKDFAVAEKEGKAAYADQKDAVAAKQKAEEATIAKLADDVKAGKLTQEELDRRLTAE